MVRKRAARARRAAEVLGPTPERAAKGAFRLVDVELESHQDRRAKAYRDFAFSTIDRWRKNRLITESQYKACDYFREVYQASGLLGRVTSAYEGRSTVAARGFGPGNTLRQCEAISELQYWLGKDGKPGRLPSKYADVFVNVVVFDMSTGEAGSLAGYTNARAEDRAKLFVEFCADVIAMDKRF